MTLSPEQIKQLLAKDVKPAFIPTQKPNSVNGPLKYTDKELRCALRGCTSPTHFTVDGIPRCYVHALCDLNDKLVTVEAA